MIVGDAFSKETGKFVSDRVSCRGRDIVGDSSCGVVCNCIRIRLRKGLSG